MSQTLLTNFFIVRKPGSQGENFKQNLARGKEAAVNKRKREDDEEEDDWNKEDPPLCIIMYKQGKDRYILHFIGW